MKTKKFCLTEDQMPTQWYNIVADICLLYTSDAADD